ncbi:hypothetical protein [Inquilinus limosus]|uniref:Uncharacterized protein n=1 Tax=Inquilinus limosus TaxID=171674 RepID=A0A211YSY5_9PROT|nr:hypothetical protein [Inquilinus limosus]OWJ56175.1 hypothetical protein BWR60_35270 [Inquilinus limosus]
MNEAPSESRELRPADPDLHWTGWALDTLREMVSIDMRTKRMTATQQLQTSAGPDAPDFDLKQSRLSRSVRLSLAMSERIRADYLLRKDERVESGEQARRRKLREQVAEAAVKAVAAPDKDWDADYVRSAVRERLNEDDVLDAQLDLLSPEEFLREVCRKIGRPPPSIPLPPGLEDLDGPDEGANDNSGLGAGGAAARAGGGEGWAEPTEESAEGCPPPRQPTPDSS